MTENTVTEEVTAAVQSYLDALYLGDVEKFRSVFHPRAQLYSATEGNLVNLNVDAYLEMVANRPSPQEKGDTRQDEILSVTIASPTTAHARVKDVYLPKRFVDDLTFVLVDGKWQIVSKVWHFEV
ncbi:nuclear transport factor 2 family protein [Rhizobium sp. CNPSo 3968]|uniref:nuclear transport factor 2 family protein n=1 Tax=Rhizobium sp. CNPSo 3968 TaxID=3021408 RepID=UPI000DDC4250|nr:nuclear transport factor 2 family protein [Rhizobium sp. CNPSo 3968]MDK4717874.1 nuclear transport factor 2 family protein [Rhizobium sp. CNPSo 3968]